MPFIIFGKPGINWATGSFVLPRVFCIKRRNVQRNTITFY